MQSYHRLFFVSLFLTRLADQILLFLVPLVVFQTTQSVSWSGIAFFVETLPRYLSFPICGALCDRASPLRLLQVSQICRAFACIGGVAGYAAFGGIGWLIGLSALAGILTTQGVMAREVMLPQVFHDHRFEKVASYTNIAEKTGTVLGPMLAAGLLGIAPWEYVVAVAALLFLTADGAVVLWRRTGAISLTDPEPTSERWTAPIRTALVHIVRLPGLLPAIIQASAVNLVYGATVATAAAMVTGLHGRSEVAFALLQAGGAVTAIAVLMAVVRYPLPLRTLGFMSFVGIFLGGLFSGASPTVWGYAAGFCLIIGCDNAFGVYIRTLRKQIIPARDLGKTTGLIALLNNLSQPLAGLIVGLVADPAQTGLVIVGLTLVMGVMGIMAVAAGARLARTRA